MDKGTKPKRIRVDFLLRKLRKTFPTGRLITSPIYKQGFIDGVKKSIDIVEKSIN